MFFDQKSQILLFNENHWVYWYIKGELISVSIDQNNAPKDMTTRANMANTRRFLIFVHLYVGSSNCLSACERKIFSLVKLSVVGLAYLYFVFCLHINQYEIWQKF